MLPGWCAGVDFDTRIIPTDFNYQHRLIPEHFNRLCSIWGTANSNSLVYTHLFMDKVKIKRGGTLFERAVNSGFNIISEKVERAINSDGYMRASDLFVIFRILNVISSDYIRVNHQLKYNRVAAAMSILADNNLQVPFLRDGKIRFMAASKSAGLAEAGMRTQRQSTMPVAQVQGISVY